MANHKSSEKRARQTIKKTAVNTRRKSAVKTFEKNLVKALEAKNTKDLETLLKTFASQVDRAAKKGVVSRAHASRKIGRLSQKVSAALK